MTTTRALCPLNCGWYHDQHDPVQPQVVEAALRAHLETHTLEQWVVALHAARTDTARVRAKALREAADFVRDAHYRDGLSVQEIGTALRLTAARLAPEARDGA